MRLAIEVDGRLTHSVPSDVERDRIRQLLIEERAWTVLRISAREVRRHPERFVARVRSALRELRHPAVV